ncbi:MAG: 4Fe-4S binding protein [Desulfobacterales bacterium]|nr:4Fe-4S binding protein [Desulfobacterales bacterium]
MDRTVNTTIDKELCNGCGLCVEVCSHDTISIQDGIACVTGEESSNCDHCSAACPNLAIRVECVDSSMSEFNTFEADGKWLPHGRYDIRGLVNLMQSRRSCRNFLEKPVERSKIEDLVKIGITAPSGTNCQMWTFTILPDRQTVDTLGESIAKFYKNINGLASKFWIRSSLKLFGKPELSWYYENYFESVKKGIDDWEKNGKDPLFHGATAVIIVGSKKEASCPAEDALLATQNILLAAHSMGLGTCLVGFVVNAMKKDKSICRHVNIPDNETPYAVIAMGYPDEKYVHVTGRKPVEMRYFAV